MSYPNVAKITLSFAQGVYGWTENYFLDNPSSDFSVEIPIARQLLTKRAAMTGKQTTLPYFKISNESELRDVYVEGSSAAGNTSKDSEDGNVAILCKKFDSTKKINTITYLRGAWDEVFTTGGLFDYANADFQAVWNSWASFLFSNSFGFIARDPAQRQQSNVTALVANLDHTITVTTEDNIFFVPPIGTKIKAFISGVRGAASVNGAGIWKVTGVNTIQSLNPIPILPYTGGGQVSFNSNMFYAMFTITNERVCERKVGRPLYLSRGRQKGRRLY